MIWTRSTTRVGDADPAQGRQLSHRAWRSVYCNMLIDRDIRGNRRLAHVGPPGKPRAVPHLVPFMLRRATNRHR